MWTSLAINGSTLEISEVWPFFLTRIREGAGKVKRWKNINLFSGEIRFEKKMACFYFPLLIHGRENIAFGQIFEFQIKIDLNVLRSPESENQAFSDWSERMDICVYYQ